MKKIVKLKESDLVRLIEKTMKGSKRRTINEQKTGVPTSLTPAMKKVIAAAKKVMEGKKSGTITDAQKKMYEAALKAFKMAVNKAKSKDKTVNAWWSSVSSIFNRVADAGKVTKMSVVGSLIGKSIASLKGESVKGRKVIKLSEADLKRIIERTMRSSMLGFANGQTFKQDVREDSEDEETFNYGEDEGADEKEMGNLEMDEKMAPADRIAEIEKHLDELKKDMAFDEDREEDDDILDEAWNIIRNRKLRRKYSIIKEEEMRDATWSDFWKYWGFRPGDEQHQDYSDRRDGFWAKEGTYATLMNTQIIDCSPTLRDWVKIDGLVGVDEGERDLLSPEEKTNFENTVNLQEVITCYNKFNKGEASFYIDTEEDDGYPDGDDAVPSITHDYRTKKMY